jgi:NAD(P)-dependent dehydrogenase (short-subunit alcohol dehydrogenase family)
MDRDLFSVRDQVVIVTGAARGNGRTIAEGFLQAGAQVLLVDILPDVKGTVLGYANPLAEAVVCDLTRPAELASLVDGCIARHGRIDTLVNNAGISLASIDPYDDEAWARTFDVNLTAAFRLSRLVLREMATRKAGSIINITSLGAQLGFPNNPSYQAAKGGLRQLSRAMARDFGHFGIRVNNVCPGYIRTHMTQRSFDDPVLREQRAEKTFLNRWGEPSDLVGPCLFLASRASSYMTGGELHVDGGWTAKGL